jgi:transcription elongation factor Elf1
MNETGQRAVEERRASVCPFCNDERGEARSISISGGIKTIHYVCGACHHEWDRSIPDPDVYKRRDS